MTRYPSWKNIVLYQTVWFGSVLAQNYFVLPVLLLLSVHFYLCQNRRDEMLVVVLCAASGILGDALLTRAGVFGFEPSQLMFIVPFWLMAIWVGFASTLRHGLAFLVKRPPVAVLAAGIGAPIVYLAAARLGAVQFPLGNVKTAVIVGSVWIIQMCLFLIIVKGVGRFSTGIKSKIAPSV